MLHHASTSANLEALMVAANKVLFYSGETRDVSRRQAKRWMSQNADFFKKLKTKPMHAKRLAAHIVNDIQDYFKDFLCYKDYQAIHNNNMLNPDKIEYLISVTTREYVIVLTNYKVVYPQVSYVYQDYKLYQPKRRFNNYLLSLLLSLKAF